MAWPTTSAQVGINTTTTTSPGQTTPPVVVAQLYPRGTS